MKNFKKFKKGLCKILSVVLISSSFMFLSSCGSEEDKKVFDQALELQKNSKYEDAIGLYNEIINKYPQSKFVSNSSVKLNQCIDSIIKDGDELSSKKDYFKAVACYENALKFRSNDIDLQNKISTTKNLVTGDKQKAETASAPATKTNTTSSTEDECKTAIEALNAYKGKKIQDFQSVSKILTMLKDWESAWESRNIDLYSSYYDSNFVGVSGGKTMNYNDWISYKKDLFNSYTSINVETQFNNAIVEGNKLKLYFDQWFKGYGANPYSDHTSKELIFEYKQSGWVITSEKPY